MECRDARIGCVNCKKILAESISMNLESFRERRASLASRPGYVNEVLADGANRAGAIAEQTITEVRTKMKLLQRSDLD